MKRAAGNVAHAEPATHAGEPDHEADVHASHAAHKGHREYAGHDKHAGHSVAMFRDKFWLSLVFTIPTLIWGHMLPHAFGYTPPLIPEARWIPAVFGTVVFLYGGLPFVQGAIRELRNRVPGMMTLIALAISVAIVFSITVTLGYPCVPLWEEFATLVTIMLLGHWIEMGSINQAQGALAELAKLLPSNAVRAIRGASGHERTEEVPLTALMSGDLVLVRPGASIPADGEVHEGHSNVNESMITGESRPVRKHAGDCVIAGTVNGEGSLRVTVTDTGERTALAGIMRLVEQAQTSRSRSQVIADRAAFWLTLMALGAGALTFIGWLAVGAEPAYAVERLVTVLVIACPHALGLAVPLVIAISTTLGARNGLLVRDRRGLEEARLLNAVVFDKTGTLTLGEHRVVAVGVAASIEESEALRLAAGIEQDAEHPVARAIVMSATERRLIVPRVAAFEAIPGYGVQADLDRRRLAVGGPNLPRRDQIVVPAEIEAFAAEAILRAQSIVYLTERGGVLAAFAVADAVRPESAEAVGREIGIDAVFAQVLPEEKVAKIRDLQRGGMRVAMVGDRVNDAPALVAADVGIAIGAGTDVAVEAGDVVLVRSDPRDVPRIIGLSRATYRKMVQNLWWAAGYNIVAIPLAAGVLALIAIVLSPAVGAVLMSFSTVIVALNAQLLRRAEL